MLDWTILIFLAGGSASFVAGLTGLSSSGSDLFWEGLLARHFSLWARSRGALALTTVLQLMHLTPILSSSTAKPSQIFELCHDDKVGNRCEK